MNPVIIGNATLYHADCIEVMAGIHENSLDSIICDPPYLISFMSKGFDTQHKSLPGANEGQKMQEWHRRWVTEAYRILKPGGHLAAFGGDRTHHRLMSAMEDVGFELRFCCYYLFGSGFPKSADAVKMLNKHKEVCSNNKYQGYGTALKPAVEPICVGRKPMIGTLAENLLTWVTGAMNLDASRVKSEGQLADDYAYRRLSSLYSSVCNGDLSPEQLLDLLAYIVFALRSYNIGGIDHSHNEVCQDDTLLEGALYENLVARLFPNGVWCGRSLWSIPDSLSYYQSYPHLCDAHIRLLKDAAQGGSPLLADALERTCLNQPLPERNHESLSSDPPSNSDDFLLALSVSYIIGEYCTLYSSPQISQGRFPPHLLHDGSDVVKKCFPEIGSAKESRSGVRGGSSIFGSKTIGTPDKIGVWPADSGGSASRFFPSLPYDEEDCATLFYCAKASKSDRDECCDRIQPKHGSEITGRTIDSAGLQMSDGKQNPYAGKASPINYNFHVSVKPTNLMRWICRLLTPKGGTLLDPFMGSGSTLKAAVLENFTCIGIEMDADYFAIAEARVAHVSPEVYATPSRPERFEVAPRQQSMF